MQQQELAENAQLLMRDFCGGAGAAVTVTIDGQPATLSGTVGSEPYLMSLNPPVSAGQTVLIDFGQSEFEPQEATTLTVVGPDTTPPELGAPRIEIATDQVPAIDCGEDGDATTRVTAKVPAINGDDVRYVFSIYFDGELIGEKTAVAQAEQPDVATAITTALDPSEVCVDVRAIDAAGNESEMTEDCVEGPGADDDDKAGCACTATPGAGGWLALPLLGLLGLLRRRLG